MDTLKQVGQVHFFVDNATFIPGLEITPDNKYFEYIHYGMWLRFLSFEQCIQEKQDFDYFLLLSDIKTGKFVDPCLVQRYIGGMKTCSKVERDQMRFFNLADIAINKRLSPLGETFTYQEFNDAIKTWPMTAIAYEMPGGNDNGLCGSTRYVYNYVVSKQDQNDSEECKWIEI
jgi:hypothetical protein